jgi:hypothetical protein
VLAVSLSQSNACFKLKERATLWKTHRKTFVPECAILPGSLLMCSTRHPSGIASAWKAHANNFLGLLWWYIQQITDQNAHIPFTADIIENRILESFL